MIAILVFRKKPLNLCIPCSHYETLGLQGPFDGPALPFYRLAKNNPAAGIFAHNRTHSPGQKQQEDIFHILY